MDETPGNSCIYILAGTNGAGKSSIGGAAFRAAGADYFNPDEAARRILSSHPRLSAVEANGVAWLEGLRLLGRAIAERRTYALETTLGGDTITERLLSAMSAGIEVRIWYVGLNSPALNVARVRARVAAGGHDIPEATIRRRYDRSLRNLVRLLPGAAEVRVFDNSFEADPKAGRPPRPRLLLHVRGGEIVSPADLSATPEWAKPVVAAALKR